MPAKYLSELRMRLAIQYIGQENQAIETVALRLGYRSLAAFSRAFKRIVGQSDATGYLTGPESYSQLCWTGVPSVRSARGISMASVDRCLAHRSATHFTPRAVKRACDQVRSFSPTPLCRVK